MPATTRCWPPPPILGPVDPRLPLLLVAARDDTLSPPSGNEQIAGAHGSADVRVIDGIGHQIPIEDAHRTTQILTASISACFAQASRTGQPVLVP
jgi:pimeloyl-ACP methyl ester carboxylesterase